MRFQEMLQLDKCGGHLLIGRKFHERLHLFNAIAEKIKELIHELADSPSQKDVEKIVFGTLTQKDISKFGTSAKAVAEFLREVDAACERQNK